MMLISNFAANELDLSTNVAYHTSRPCPLELCPSQNASLLINDPRLEATGKCSEENDAHTGRV